MDEFLKTHTGQMWVAIMNRVALLKFLIKKELPINATIADTSGENGRRPVSHNRVIANDQ